MSEQPKDGGAAFPRPTYVELDQNQDNAGCISGDDGMSLRDWFAGQALAGQLASNSNQGNITTPARRARETKGRAVSDDLDNKTDTELKPWPGDRRYLVSRGGRVFSRFAHHRSGRIIRYTPPRLMNSRIGSEGYWITSIMTRGKQRTFLIHRMILQAWVGPCPPGFEAAHKDGVRSNRRLSNLCWKTKSANMRDQQKHGTALNGRRNHNAKINEFAVERVLRGDLADKSERRAGKILGVSSTVVHGIRNGTRWKNAVIALLRGKRAEKGTA